MSEPTTAPKLPETGNSAPAASSAWRDVLLGVLILAAIAELMFLDVTGVLIIWWRLHNAYQTDTQRCMARTGALIVPIKKKFLVLLFNMSRTLNAELKGRARNRLNAHNWG